MKLRCPEDGGNSEMLKKLKKAGIPNTKTILMSQDEEEVKDWIKKKEAFSIEEIKELFPDCDVEDILKSEVKSGRLKKVYVKPQKFIVHFIDSMPS